MGSRRLLSLCVLTVLLVGCLQAQEISEHDLYGSETWQSDSPCVVVRAQEDVHLIEEWLEDTKIPVSQVKCEASSGSDLCTLLSTHVAVVRKEGRVLVGVAKGANENNTVAAVMENLFGPEFHLISDYAAMKEFQDSHPQHLLAYARSYREAAFDKYLYFLKALLTVEDRSTHIAVTKQPLALPLSHRPKFSKTAELFLWLVSDGKWCQYSNSSHPLHLVGGIAAFYNRIKVPFKLHYTSEKLTSQYRDMGLFTAYIIHSPGKKKLAERVASMFVETYCNFFMFLIAEKASRKNKLTKALYLSAGENNLIVIEPPITDMPPIHLSLEEIEEQDILTMLDPIQEEYTEQYMVNPETGKPVKRRRKVVVTDPRTIGYMAVDSQEDMLVAFCDQKDGQICGHFENSLQKVADIITTSAYQKQEIGFAVVHCSSLEDVQKYGVDDYPYIAYYNVSDGQWSEVQENNFQEIVDRALGRAEETEEEKAEQKEKEKEWEEEQKKFLKDNNKPDPKLLREADKKSREYLEPRPADEITPPPPPETQSEHPPLQSSRDDDHQPAEEREQTHAILDEDDHFGQLTYSLGTPEYPEELILSDETFGVHINSYSTTMVTFYVPWEPHCDGVMHYMLQALEDLPEDSECSMAVVNCADYPDLCSGYGIVHYPTVLLFRASPNDWTPYKGMMDSRQMLKVLLHQEQAEEKTDTLMELTPETFPQLIQRGDLSQTVLVVWAGERGGGGGGGGEEVDGVKELSALVVSGDLGNYSFAWMDCNDHKDLLQKIFPEQFECESLLLFDFQQRTVYQLPPTLWLSQDSLPVAMTDFLSHYKSGSLAASGHLVDWAWPPLQPPIKFPSGRGQKESKDTSPPSSPPSPPSSPSSPPPTSSETPSSPPAGHHAHTEL